MTKAGRAREVALRVLHQVDTGGAFVDLALKKGLQSTQMSPRDRALAAEISYGATRYLLYLDWVIQEIARRPGDRVDPWSRNILRLTLYQLLYLDRVPGPAACHAGVELAKKYAPRGGDKFVNGVLRNFLRQQGSLVLPDRSRGPVKYLSLRYSFPQWMVSRWVQALGEGEAELLLASLNRVAPLEVRANTLKNDRAELKEVLGEGGVGAEEGRYAPQALSLKARVPLASLEAFKQGLFHIQGQSSMLASLLLAPRPGETILDSCSGPGGKASHLGELMENRGRVLCCDLHSHRLELVRKNGVRLGLHNLEMLPGDARDLPRELVGKVDRALVDAPCSGLGVVARKPDLKWKRGPGDIKGLPVLQGELLQEAARLLRPGGTLVYSVCTLEEEETGEVCRKFTRENPGFSCSSLVPYLPGDLAREPGASGGALYIYPHRHRLDGFFLARWEKK